VDDGVLNESSPESVQEKLVSNGSCSNLGQIEHWLDHKSHILGQHHLHSVFISLPSLGQWMTTEVNSPGRQ